MSYPEHHAQIVATLLGGRFVTDDMPFFSTISNSQGFYQKFFEASYGYTLAWEGTYCYLSSKETKETASRDMLLLLALLAYEYHNDQKDIVDTLLNKTILVADIERYVKESSKYNDLIQDTQAEELKKFLDYWRNKNLLTYTRPDESAFRFKAPIKTFLDVAAKLAESHLLDES